MSLKNGWHSLFTDEKKPASTTVPDSAQDTKGTIGGTPSAYPTPYPTQNPQPQLNTLYTGLAPASQPDTGMVTELTNAATSTKESGYIAFKSIFDAMGMLPEDQRYGVALNALKGQKITATDVVRALTDMIRLVDAQSNDFETAWNTANQTQVTSVKNSITKIESVIDSKKKEIADLEKQRVDLTASSGAAQVKLEQQRATFHVSFDAVRSSYNTELLKIQALIPPPAVSATK